MCWGARLIVAETRVKTLPVSRKIAVGNDTLNVASNRSNSWTKFGPLLPVAPCSFFRERWTRQEFARFARRYRALDPLGASFGVPDNMVDGSGEGRFDSVGPICRAG